MSVIPDCLRSAVISNPLGDVTFTPSAGAVLSYEARVYAAGTSTPVVATKYLGVPNADPVTGLIKVNCRTMLDALPAGSYTVKIAATGAGGTDESDTTTAYDVPLQLP
jgi:hypothetical protein